MFNIFIQIIELVMDEDDTKAAFTWRDMRQDHVRLDTRIAHLVAP